LDVIQRAHILPDECYVMIAAMLPHSLRSTAAERHDFQIQMVGQVMEVLTGLEASRADTLREAEARFEALPEEKAAAKVAHATTTERVVSASDLRMQKDVATKDAEKQMALAGQALVVANEKVKSLDGEHSSALAEKLQLEELIRKHLEPLKAGAFTGKEWRQRDKCIAEVSTALEKLGTEESLRVAMVTAFRRKTPESSNKFSNMSIKYGEEVLTKRIATLDEEVNGYESEKHRREHAAEQATAALEAAKKAQQDALADFITADNDLQSATAAQTEAEAAIAALEGPKGASVAALVQRSKAELSEAHESLSKFRVLCAGPKTETAA